MAKKFALRLLSLALVLTCALALCTATAFAEGFSFETRTKVDSYRIVVLGLDDEAFTTYARLIRDKSPDDISITVTRELDYLPDICSETWVVVCDINAADFDAICAQNPKNVVFVNSYIANAPEHTEYVEDYQYENLLARIWASVMTGFAREGSTVHLYMSESDNDADVISRVASYYLDMYSRAFDNLEKFYNAYTVYGEESSGEIIIHYSVYEDHILETAMYDVIRLLWQK